MKHTSFHLGCLVAVCLALPSAVQGQQFVFHPDLVMQQARNSAFKQLYLNLAEEQTRRIEEHRRAILGHLATMERIQQALHKSLTEVHAAISDGKTLIHIGRRVPNIFALMQEAMQLAADKPQLLPTIHREAMLCQLRLTDLIGYLQRSLLQGDGRTLIDPARRGELVRKVHDELRVTEALAAQMVATLQISRLQDAIDVIIPYQDHLQADKAIIQSILNRWKP